MKRKGELMSKKELKKKTNKKMKVKEESLKKRNKMHNREFNNLKKKSKLCLAKRVTKIIHK